MKKPIKPASPVSGDPDLQFVERLAREQIASKKRTNPKEGSDQSLSLTLSIKEQLDPNLERGKKVLRGAKEGHKIVYGSRDDHELRVRQIKALYRQFRKEHPDWLEKQLDTEVGNHCGISSRTARLYKPPRDS